MCVGLDSPKRARKSRGGSKESSPSLTPSTAPAPAPATPLPTSSSSSPLLKPHTSLPPAPPPHFSLSSTSAGSNPIGAAAAASPYAIQQQMQLQSAEPLSESQALFAQLTPLPWNEEEQRKEEALAAVAAQRALAADVAQLSAQVGQVQQMFGELGQLVQSQQRPIEQVAENVAAAKDKSEQALAQVSQVFFWSFSSCQTQREANTGVQM
jgi:hypothetical protein